MKRRDLLKAAALTLAAPALAAPGLAANPPALRFVPQVGLTGVDPAWTGAVSTANHGYYVFDTLYACDGRTVPQPQMAAGHEISDNGCIWRIRLRDGLAFHDGSKVRAIDCAASLERWAKADATFGLLLAPIVEKWGAADDRTVELRLTRPFPMLLDAIGKPQSRVPFIYPEHLARLPVTKAFNANELIGSGPYRFRAGEFDSGNFAAYEKFAGYVPRAEPSDWGAGGKIAHYGRIEWKTMPDPATAAAALLHGEVDWWEQVQPDLMPLLARDPAIVMQVQNPTGQAALMRLNHLQPPFNNRAIRRAVMMAINQDDYLHAVWGDDASLSHPCYSLFACGTPYAGEGGAELLKGTHEIAAVKRALAEAGYAGEKVVILNPTDYPLVGPLGQVTFAVLKAIGMNVELAESDWGTVLRRRESKAPVEKGGWSIFHGYNSGTSNSNPAIAAIVRGEGRTGGWYGWPIDDRSEELVAEWLYEPDAGRRAAIAAAINREALENVSTIPLGQSFLHTGYRRGITGIEKGAAPYPWSVRPAG